MTDRVGQQLGNYQLIRLLGVGGFAEVYLGEHIHLGTQAAIKVLHTQLTSDDVVKFRTEARTIARLIHPHIVRVLEFGVEGKTPFLVMDYASNGTLRERHPKGVALPLPLIVAYVKQAADALQYAHDEKLIHRDIKPENMLLGRRNEILLSDFGIALVAQSSRYQSAQEMAGTMAYMAPEQIQGKPRPASDQYSLGIVVYEWLTGDRPFHGSLTELVGQHLSVLPPPLQEKISTITPEVDRVVLTALAKDPKQRFESIQAFATALEQASQLVQPASSVVAPPADPVTQSEVEALSPEQPSLPLDMAATILPDPSPLPINIDTPPHQSLQSTNRVTPLSQSVQSNDMITQSANSKVSPGLSQEPITLNMPQFSKRSLSRRTVVVGLVGLAVIGVGAGITWMTHSQGSLVSSPSSHVKTNPTPTSVSTTPPVPSPSPSPPSLGMNLVTYHGHSGAVNDVVWLPNGTLIASCSADSTVQIWDAASGNTLLTYSGHSGTVWAVAYAPDGKRIASAGGELNVNQGSHDHAIQVWDVTTQQQLFTYGGHSDAVLTLKWSPDGTRIASGSADSTVQVWDARTGRTFATYRGHSSEVLDLAWSPDNKRIVSGSNDRTIQVWDARTGTLIFTYPGQSRLVLCVAWSPNGAHIASSYRGNQSDAIVEVWDSSTGNLRLTYLGHSQQTQALAKSPKRAFSTSWAAKMAEYAPLELFNAHRMLSGSGIGVYSVAWSPDSKRIASGGGIGDFTAQVWDASNGKTLVTYRGHSSYVKAIAWSSDGRRVASGSYDNTVQVWQAK